MGDGLKRYSNYANNETSPTLIACGSLDPYGSWDSWPAITANYKKAGIPHLAMSMIGLAHDYPYGYDTTLDYDRYTTCFDFFDYYLMGAGNTSPELVYISPNTAVFDIVDEQNNQIDLKFIGTIDEKEIQKVTVTSQVDGDALSGTWLSSEGGTLWSFQSDEFIVGQTYTVTVPTTISDSNGVALSNGRTKDYEIISSNQLFNVAKHKNVSCSQWSSIAEYTRCAEVVDGINTGRYTSRWVNDNNYASSNPIPLWLEIDLGSNYTLHYADVFTGTDDETDVKEQIVNYELQYADSEGNWKTIPGAVVSENKENYNLLEFTEPVNTDKIRLYSDDSENKFVVLKEIRVFGRRPEESEEEKTYGNVALNKTVTAGVASEGSLPEKIVDGVSNLVNISEVWFVSQYRSTDEAWAEIDLGAAYTIDSSTIYTGYANGTNRCTDYKLQYWKDDAWVDIPGGAQTENTEQKSTLTFTEAVTTSKVRFAANHVRFTVQEIEIYGVPAEIDDMNLEDVSKQVTLEQIPDSNQINVYLEGFNKSGNPAKIENLVAVDLNFAITGTFAITSFVPANSEWTYEITDTGSYLIHEKGMKDGAADLDGQKILLGTLTLEGYGDGTITAAADGDAVQQRSKDGQNLVISSVAESDTLAFTITVPTNTLTVNVTFPNNIADNAAAYQDMKATISGGDLAEDIVVNFGSDEEVALVDNAYTFTQELTENTTYTVTISGAGYRTTRYSVNMAEDKVLTFWNNVMDEAKVIETGKDTSAVKTNFLAGDIVADNNINIYDLSAVVSYFGTVNVTDAASQYAKYDLNRDGVIDSKDVALVLVSWGN